MKTARWHPQLWSTMMPPASLKKYHYRDYLEKYLNFDVQTTTPGLISRISNPV